MHALKASFVQRVCYSRFDPLATPFEDGTLSDVWALGCVLYELCTSGQHPFDAESLPALAHKVARGSFAPISPKYSTTLRQLVLSMLAVNANARPSIDAILRQPYVVKHVCNFVKDAVSRCTPTVLPPLLPVSAETMMFSAAAHRAAGVAAGEAMSRAVSAGLGPHANHLYEQLTSLGLRDAIANALTLPAKRENDGSGTNLRVAATTTRTPAEDLSANARPPFNKAVAPVVALRDRIAGGARMAVVAALTPPVDVAMPPRRMALSPRSAARHVLRERRAALEREEERQRGVQRALERLHHEKELREKQRGDMLRKVARLAFVQAHDRAIPVVTPPVLSQGIATPAFAAAGGAMRAPHSVNGRVRVAVGAPLPQYNAQLAVFGGIGYKPQPSSALLHRPGFGRMGPRVNHPPTNAQAIAKANAVGFPQSRPVPGSAVPGAAIPLRPPPVAPQRIMRRIPSDIVHTSAEKLRLRAAAIRHASLQADNLRLHDAAAHRVIVRGILEVAAPLVSPIHYRASAFVPSADVRRIEVDRRHVADLDRWDRGDDRLSASPLLSPKSATRASSTKHAAASSKHATTSEVSVSPDDINHAPMSHSLDATPYVSCVTRASGVGNIAVDGNAGAFYKPGEIPDNDSDSECDTFTAACQPFLQRDVSIMTGRASSAPPANGRNDSSRVPLHSEVYDSASNRLVLSIDLGERDDVDIAVQETELQQELATSIVHLRGLRATVAAARAAAVHVGAMRPRHIMLAASKCLPPVSEMMPDAAVATRHALVDNGTLDESVLAMGATRSSPSAHIEVNVCGVDGTIALGGGAAGRRFVQRSVLAPSAAATAAAGGYIGDARRRDIALTQHGSAVAPLQAADAPGLRVLVTSSIVTIAAPRVLATDDEMRSNMFQRDTGLAGWDKAGEVVTTPLPATPPSASPRERSSVPCAIVSTVQCNTLGKPEGTPGCKVADIHDRNGARVADVDEYVPDDGSCVPEGEYLSTSDSCTENDSHDRTDYGDDSSDDGAVCATKYDLGTYMDASVAPYAHVVSAVNASVLHNEHSGSTCNRGDPVRNVRRDADNSIAPEESMSSGTARTIVVAANSATASCERRTDESLDDALPPSNSLVDSDRLALHARKIDVIRSMRSSNALYAFIPADDRVVHQWTASDVFAHVPTDTVIGTPAAPHYNTQPAMNLYTVNHSGLASGCAHPVEVVADPACSSYVSRVVTLFPATTDGIDAALAHPESAGASASLALMTRKLHEQVPPSDSDTAGGHCSAFSQPEASSTPEPLIGSAHSLVAEFYHTLPVPPVVVPFDSEAPMVAPVAAGHRCAEIHQEYSVGYSHLSATGAQTSLTTNTFEVDNKSEPSVLCEGQHTAVAVEHTELMPSVGTLVGAQHDTFRVQRRTIAANSHMPYERIAMQLAQPVWRATSEHDVQPSPSPQYGSLSSRVRTLHSRCVARLGSALFETIHARVKVALLLDDPVICKPRASHYERVDDVFYDAARTVSKRCDSGTDDKETTRAVSYSLHEPRQRSATVCDTQHCTEHADHINGCPARTACVAPTATGVKTPASQARCAHVGTDIDNSDGALDAVRRSYPCELAQAVDDIVALVTMEQAVL